MEPDWGKLPQWAQRDLGDMMNSHCTEFDRCHKCNRLHDKVYICPYCGHDNSTDYLKPNSSHSTYSKCRKIYCGGTK